MLGGTLINSTVGVIDGGSTLSALTLSGIIGNGELIEGKASQGLILTGAVANSKTIEALGTSATVTIIDGAVINASAGAILASGVGAEVELDGATIAGGTLSTGGTQAMIEVASAADAVFGNATNDGAVEINDLATLDLQGSSFTNKGTVVLVGSVAATLQIDNNLTLLGTGAVLMSNTAGGANIQASGLSGTTLTNDSHISGMGEIGHNGLILVNSGTIDADSAIDPLIINNGIITADTNAGILEATAGGDGGLDILNNFANTGTLEALGTSATVLIENAVTVSNTNGGIISASGTAAKVVFDNATILGGKLQTTGSNAAIETDAKLTTLPRLHARVRFENKPDPGREVAT